MPGRVAGLARDSSSPSPSPSSSASLAHDLEYRGRNPGHTSDPPTNHTHSPMEHFKRSSIPGVSHFVHKHPNSNEKQRKSSRSPSVRAVRSSNEISVTVESPPNIFYGPPDSSTGALFSGRLRVHVVSAPEIILDTFSMQLLAKVTTKKPIVKDCVDCMFKQSELHRWKFLTEPKKLLAGDHEFPFSHLIPGHLPTTSHGQLGVLEYFLHAKATTRHGEELTLKHPVQLSRAVSPAPERTAQRIFPPMDLTVYASFSPVIFPIGRFDVSMRMTNVSEKPEDGNPRSASHPADSYHRWRLRKMIWRLEETEKMVSPACSRHIAKVGGEGKGVAHEDTRVLAHADLKDGWKTDFDAGEIDMEFSVSTTASPRPLCDVESPTGLKVSHALVIELIVADEWAKCKRPEVASPTGGARVLRATFGMTVTERAGLGVSWDEEQPPMYEDVPKSPPRYGIGMSEVHDYTGPPLDGIERLNLGEPRRPAPAMSSPLSRGTGWSVVGGSEGRRRVSEILSRPRRHQFSSLPPEAHHRPVDRFSRRGAISAESPTSTSDVPPHPDLTGQPTPPFLRHLAHLTRTLPDWLQSLIRRSRRVERRLQRAENARQNAEDTLQSAEDARQSTENTDQIAENPSQSAENAGQNEAERSFVLDNTTSRPTFGELLGQGLREAGLEGTGTVAWSTVYIPPLEDDTEPDARPRPGTNPANTPATPCQRPRPQTWSGVQNPPLVETDLQDEASPRNVGGQGSTPEERDVTQDSHSAEQEETGNQNPPSTLTNLWDADATTPVPAECQDPVSGTVGDAKNNAEAITHLGGADETSLPAWSEWRDADARTPSSESSRGGTPGASTEVRNDDGDTDMREGNHSRLTTWTDPTYAGAPPSVENRDSDTPDVCDETQSDPGDSERDRPLAALKQRVKAKVMRVKDKFKLRKGAFDKLREEKREEKERKAAQREEGKAEREAGEAQRKEDLVSEGQDNGCFRGGYAEEESSRMEESSRVRESSRVGESIRVEESSPAEESSWVGGSSGIERPSTVEESKKTQETSRREQ